MFWIITGIVVGVVGLAWVYHRFSAKTAAVIDTAADEVNKVINKVKDDVK